MPEFIMEGQSEDSNGKETNGHCVPYKENFSVRSPRSTLSTRSPESDSIDLAIDGAVDTSIEQLYHNVCDMQSSDHSPSRNSFLSYGEESRIDSELRYLAGGNYGEFEIMKDSGIESKDGATKKENGSKEKNSQFPNSKSLSSTHSKRLSHLKSESEASSKLNTRSKSLNERPPTGKRNGKSSRKINAIFSMKNERNFSLGGEKLQNVTEDPMEEGYLGPYLLKKARNLVSSGDNPQKALELALRSMKSFERCGNGKPNLELVMCLHVIAALYCSLGQHSDAIPILEHSIEIPVMDEGQNHALAKFAGCMQLGDTYAMLGQIENSLLCYTAGLEIQRQVLGEKDSRLGETCRYVAEAHIQALQFDEAEKLCQMALEIHRENSSPASPEEAADRRLMGLICDSKGDYESALEHYVLASMAMAMNGQEIDVASIDCSIGDAYLSLARYDEAVFAYQKALTAFKSTKGENHPSVASVFVRLADLYNKTGKYRESKSYCENALRIYAKPIPGSPPEEIASGLIDISAIYESMDEQEQALELLQKALKMYGNAPGQQSTIAGIEAQMGVLYYMMGSYADSYNSFKNAISKFRVIGEKKSALFAIALNQMGLACVQLYAINEAADLFEEARSILEAEHGPYHPDTLGVYSNLAGTYDAMGRSADAIEILEYVVGMRENTLGTANPDVDDEKRRLGELLKEAGRVRNRESRSLETLLDTNNSHTIVKDGIEVL
ncbi:protein KINESIN LIGHT CHAIN-RELATED 2 [Cornus florida]|uniref:protein KINESIN LIGHT CHAIN-RELATED 2 n=1 Tax=Cornus florida TaxID=4283 RepID=UPI0028A05FD5|nr:protein KINESIN LIGHT CHAIN-RELATED 2 [Cornus florida]XP_059639800.1 protein KINESIN LIGHT CHAIN-RELATED 2 [Cornus florida]XP_059639801.1 protein KINESIN LIGHT CHAIN-RELATED 2 [Cornus florida]